MCPVSWHGIMDHQLLHCRQSKDCVLVWDSYRLISTVSPDSRCAFYNSGERGGHGLKAMGY